ncbi:aldehyde dehydrogenase family protein, partial [Vibrio parahaemolyticus]
MLIGAERVAGTGDALDVENPYTEETLETIGSASADQVDAALAAAREAAPGWAGLPAGERGELLHEVA